MTERIVIESDAERESLSRAHIAGALARRALTPEQIETEISEFRKAEEEGFPSDDRS